MTTLVKGKFASITRTQVLTAVAILVTSAALSISLRQFNMLGLPFGWDFRWSSFAWGAMMLNPFAAVGYGIAGVAGNFMGGATSIAHILRPTGNMMLVLAGMGAIAKHTIDTQKIKKSLMYLALGMTMAFYTWFIGFLVSPYLNPIISIPTLVGGILFRGIVFSFLAIAWVWCGDQIIDTINNRLERLRK